MEKVENFGQKNKPCHGLTRQSRVPAWKVLGFPVSTVVEHHKYITSPRLRRMHLEGSKKWNLLVESGMVKLRPMLCIL
jgi:hypothetical protein